MLKIEPQNTRLIKFNLIIISNDHNNKDKIENFPATKKAWCSKEILQNKSIHQTYYDYLSSSTLPILSTLDDTRKIQQLQIIIAGIIIFIFKERTYIRKEDWGSWGYKIMNLI